MAILVGIFYGVISGSMSLINKVVLNTFGFPFPNVLLLVQTMVTALALEILRWQKWIDIPSYSLERGKLLLIPSVCYAVHMLLVLLALSRLSLPMYNILRRLTPLVTLFLSCIILKKRPSAVITLAVITIVTGCIITGLEDLSGSAATYVIAIASCFLQAAYLTYVQKTGLDTELIAGCFKIPFYYKVAVPDCLPISCHHGIFIELFHVPLCNKELCFVCQSDWYNKEYSYHSRWFLHLWWSTPYRAHC